MLARYNLNTDAELCALFCAVSVTFILVSECCLVTIVLALSPSHRGLVPIANLHVAAETHNREQKPGLRS